MTTPPLRPSTDVAADPGERGAAGAIDDVGGFLVLSQERLQASTVRVPARRVRLEKYVVTETRTITVQVSREQVRLVDIDPAAADVTADPHVTDPPQDPGRWMVLSEERITVTTQVVPVERVRLEVTTVTQDQVVTEDVRREQAQLDTPVNPLPQLRDRHTKPGPATSGVTVGPG